MNSDWMQDGACREVRTEMMFPQDSAGVVAAQQVCARCEVREPCLEFALSNRIEHGVWGGASERERRRLARSRRALTATGAE